MSNKLNPLDLRIFKRPAHVGHLKIGDKFTNELGELCIYLGWVEEQEQHNKWYINFVYGQQQLHYDKAGQHVYMQRVSNTNWCFGYFWPTKIGVYEEPRVEYDPELVDI